MPITFLPLALSSLSDALFALGRISRFLTSEDLPESYPIDENLPVAVQVDGNFIWETVLAAEGGEKGKVVRGDQAKKLLEAKKLLLITMADLEKEKLRDDVGSKRQETPFKLKNLKLSVPKGAFVAKVSSFFAISEFELLNYSSLIRARYYKH